ncbi:MAG TPA: MFS transporter [Acidimicrobiia bacterium]
MTKGNREGWLTPGVRGIGGASLLADLGHEVPTSLLPTLLTSTLGAPAAALGLIEGVADAGAGIAKYGGGLLADDPIRRRSVAVGGYTATAIFSSLIGVATSVWQVAVLRVGAWVARGIRVPARNALLADLTGPGTYGRAYGFERMMDNLGAVGGPLLALGLVAAFGLRGAFITSGVFGLAATGSMIYAIRHIERPMKRERVPIRIRIRPLLVGDLGRLWVPIAGFEVGNLATTLLILRATELLTPGADLESATRTALLLYAAHNLAATLVAIPAGRAADRRGFRPVLTIGFVFGLAAYLLFGITGAGLVTLAVAFVLAGITIGLVETAENGAVAEAAPEELRGSAFGFLAAIQSFGNLIASGVAGLLWTFVDPLAAFVFAAAGMVVALVGTVVLRRASVS